MSLDRLALKTFSTLERSSLAMDIHFYHLMRPPFAMAPEPDALFWSSTHAEALRAIRAGIETRQGFITLFGEAGLGKTTVLRYYLDRVDVQRFTVIALPSAHLSWHDMLIGICRALGLNDDADARSGVEQKLRQALLAAYQAGRNVVLVLDDAHRLDAKFLEHLLLFADFKVPAGKLMQIVLAGRPACAQLLQLPDLQALKRCIAVKATVTPLSNKESLDYLQHRLQQSTTQPLTRQSRRRQRIFTAAAMRCIIRRAHGNPQRLNILASDVLQAGLLHQKKPIPASLARHVLAYEDTALSLPWWKWGGVLAGLAIVLLFWRLFLPLSASAPQRHDRSEQAVAGGSDKSSVQPSIRERHDAAIPGDAPLPALMTSTLPPDIMPPTTVPQAQRWPLPLGEEVDEHPEALDAPEPAVEAEKPVDTAAVPPSPQETDTHPAAVPRPEESPAGIPHNGHEFPGATWPFDTHVVCATPHPPGGGGKGGKDIILMTYDGYRQRRLIADGELNLMPRLSPNGMMLAYTSYRDGFPNIYLRNLATGEEERLTWGPGMALPSSWSPDGRYLALSLSSEGNSEIYIYERYHKRLKRLTRHPGIDISPSFAHDSTRLVFTSDRSGSPQLYLTDIHGRRPSRLTTIGPYNTAPAWSPREDVIAFVGRTREATLDIYTIRADGSNLQRLTRGRRSHESPTWSPNGRFVMYTSRMGNRQWRHMTRIDGQEDRVLPQGGPVCHALQWVARYVP